MTAYTPRGYPYPDDYQAPADVPAALDDLASAIDADVALVSTQGNTSAAEVAALKARQVVAGNGLTGGGDLSASRTFNVGAGTGITVAADSVAVNTGVIATKASVDALAARVTTAEANGAIQSGVVSQAYATGGIVVTFPVAFVDIPNVVVSWDASAGTGVPYFVWTYNIQRTAFSVKVVGLDGVERAAGASVRFQWIAREA